MAVLTLQVFVSLLLVVGSLLLFGVSVRNRDHEHADRLSLLPMADDDASPAANERRRRKEATWSECSERGGAPPPERVSNSKENREP